MVARAVQFFVLGLAATLAIGCADAGIAPTPTAPSPPAATLTLTIHVHARTSESPISGALVRHHASRFYTNASGELSIVIDAGVDTTVEASAAGYRTMTASAIVNSNESWTFFLEPVP